MRSAPQRLGSRQPTPASMHQPFYINVNLAVGGRWAGEPDGHTAALRIDWVRAYANADTTGLPAHPN